MVDLIEQRHAADPCGDGPSDSKGCSDSRLDLKVEDDTRLDGCCGLSEDRKLLLSLKEEV